MRETYQAIRWKIVNGYPDFSDLELEAIEDLITKELGYEYPTDIAPPIQPDRPIAPTNSNPWRPAIMTRYGYPHDPYQNKYDKQYVGNRSNRLTSGISIAISPELADTLGIDMFKPTWLDVDFGYDHRGEHIGVGRYRVDDNTAYGHNPSQRVDFFDPYSKLESIDGRDLKTRISADQTSGPAEIILDWKDYSKGPWPDQSSDILPDKTNSWQPDNSWDDGEDDYEPRTADIVDPYDETVLLTGRYTKRKLDPKFIVLHDSFGEFEGTVRYITQDPSAKGSYHYIINPFSGNRVQMVYDSYQAWHAGKSYWNGYSGLNKYSYGIAFAGDTGRWKSDTEIESAAYKCVYLMRKSGIPIENIITHKDIAPDRKPDTDNETKRRVIAKVKQILDNS